MAMVEINVGCLTCLQPLGLNFLSVQSAENSSIQEALRKHFWFSEADFQLATICQSCWEQVYNFNRFYLSVEKLYQSRASYGVNVKPEPEADEPVTIKTDYETEQMEKFSADESLAEKKRISDDEVESEDEEIEDNPDGFEHHIVRQELECSPVVRSKNAKRKHPSGGSKTKNVRLEDGCIRKHVKYNCEQCGEESQTFSIFKRHALLVHGNQSPFLECCGVKYSQRFALFRHVQFLNNPEMFRCEECQKNFVDNRGYRNHMDTCHATGSGNRIFKCDRCPKSFVIQYNLWLHMENHDGWKCEACGKIFGNGKSLCDHIRRMHPDLPPLTCDICSKEFRIKSSLLRHKQTHEKQQCPLCQQMLPDGINIRAHAQEVHPDAVMCYICKQLLPTRAALQAHKVQMHGVKHPKRRAMTADAGEDQILPKRLSGKSDVDKGELYQDPTECAGINTDIGTERLESSIVVKEEWVIGEPTEVTVQDDENSSEAEQSDEEMIQGDREDFESTQFKQKNRPSESIVQNNPTPDDCIAKHVKLICAKCNQESETFKLFKEHARVVHKDKSAFVKCCGMKFRRRYRLLEHVKSLNDPDIHRCEDCNKSFPFKERYQRHMKIVHRNKKFRCDWCPKSYASQQLLRRHKRGHLENSNITQKCSQCEKLLPDEKSLRAHVLELHPEVETSEIKWAPEAQECSSDNSEDESGHLESSIVVKEEQVIEEPAEEVAQQSKNKSESEPSDNETTEDDQEISELAVVKQKSGTTEETVTRHLVPDQFIREHVNYICEKCGHESLTFKLFTEHALYEHGDQSAFVKCCGMLYRRRDLLFDHVQMVKYPGVFSCKICHIKFRRRRGYEHHLEFAHKSFQCDRCPKSYSSECKLREHKKDHVGGNVRKVKCTHCEKLFLCRRYLVSHLRQVHPDTPKFSCEVCFRDFRVESWYLEHKLKHKKLKCLLCSETYLDEKRLCTHVQKLHPGVELPVMCSICRDVLPSKDALVAHKAQEHHQQSELPDGNDCLEEGLPEASSNTSDVKEEQVFEKQQNENKSESDDEMEQGNQKESEKAAVEVKSRTKRKTFVRRYMPDDFIREHVQYTCEKCGLESLTFKLFMDHALEVHGDKSAAVECCGKKFRKKFLLFEHVQTLKNPNAHRCEDCKQNFGLRGNYTRHMRLVHGIKKYDCPHCENLLPDEKSLRVHVLKLHPKAEPPVVCTVCKDVFPSSDALEAHRARGHDNQSALPEDNEESLEENLPEWSQEKQEFELYQNQLVSMIVKSETKVGVSESLEGDPPGCSYENNSVETGQLAQMADNSDSEHSSTDEDGYDPNERSKLKSVDQQFMDDELIKKHVSYTCEHCGEECQSFFLLKKHVLDVHNVPAIIRCCGRKYHQKSVLLEHVQLVNNPEMFQCKHCPKKFTSKAMFKRHLRFLEVSAEQIQEKIKCDFCDYILTSRNNLDQHIRKWHAVAPEYTCDICSAAFHVKEWFLEHKRKHEQEASLNRKFTCVRCLENFADKKLHALHVQDHEGWELGSWKQQFPELPHYNCNICSKVFRTHPLLQQHISEHDKPVLQCPDCPQQFKVDQLLLAHVKALHPQVKSICKRCEVELPNSQALQDHMVAEHGAKRPNHQCTFCKKSFGALELLHKHIAAIHNGSKPHVCPVCSKGYITSFNLRKHMENGHQGKGKEQ